MNESMVSFQGWLGDDVELHYVGTTPVAKFRVGNTPRRFNRQQNSWVDGETTWYTVNAWRGLAENCHESLRKGEPVVVQGRLSAQLWTDDSGMQRLTYVVEATQVGHDLAQGSTVFTRRKPGAGDDSGIRAANAGEELGGPQIGSDGRGLDDLVERPSRDEEPAA